MCCCCALAARVHQHLQKNHIFPLLVETYFPASTIFICKLQLPHVTMSICVVAVRACLHKNHFSALSWKMKHIFLHLLSSFVTSISNFSLIVESTRLVSTFQHCLFFIYMHSWHRVNCCRSLMNLMLGSQMKKIFSQELLKTVFLWGLWH